MREEVNAWIRKGQGFDGVVDFDAALRDPASPLHYLGADQCGDDLHPNDAGTRRWPKQLSNACLPPDPERDARGEMIDRRRLLFGTGLLAASPTLVRAAPALRRLTMCRPSSRRSPSDSCGPSGSIARWG